MESSIHDIIASSLVSYRAYNWPITLTYTFVLMVLTLIIDIVVQSRPSDAAASLRQTPEIRDAMLAFEKGGAKYQEDTIHQAYLSVKVHGTLKTDGTYEATGDTDTAIDWMGFLYLASYPKEQRPIPDLDYVRQLSHIYLHLIYVNHDLAPQVRALAGVILDTEPIKTVDKVDSLGQFASRKKNPVQPEAPTSSANPTTEPPLAGLRKTKQALDEIEKRQQTFLQSIYPSREQNNQNPVIAGDEATEAATSQSSGDEATQAGSQADAPGQQSTRFGVTFPRPRPTLRKPTAFKPIRFKGGETLSDLPPGAVELPRPPPQLPQVDPSTGLVNTQKFALPSLPDRSKGQTHIERTGILKGFPPPNPARQEKAAQALQAVPLPLPLPQSGIRADNLLRTSTLHDSGASSSNVGRGKGLAFNPDSQVQPVEILRQQFTTNWTPFGGTSKLDATKDISLRRERAGSILQAQPQALPRFPPQTQTQTRPLQTTQLQSQRRPPPKTQTQPPLQDKAQPLPLPQPKPPLQVKGQPVSKPPPQGQPAPLPKPPTDKGSA